MIIGIGGSATNDGGAGMAQALGIKLLDKDEEQIGFGGGKLKNIFRDSFLSRVNFLQPKVVS